MSLEIIKSNPIIAEYLEKALKFLDIEDLNPSNLTRLIKYLASCYVGVKLTKGIISMYLLRSKYRNFPLNSAMKWRLGTGMFFDCHKFETGGSDPVSIWKTVHKAARNSWNHVDPNDRGVHMTWIGPTTPLLYLVSPETVGPVFKNTKEVLNKSHLMDQLVTWLGDGVLFSSDAKWKNRRRMLTPAFHFNMMHNFLPIMNKHTFAMANELKKLCESGKNKNVDVYAYITLTALDIISETAMGVSTNAQTSTESMEYVNGIYWINQKIMARMRNPFIANDTFYKAIRPIEAKKYFSCIQMLQQFTKDVITDRIKARQKEGYELSAGGEKERVFIDILLDEYEAGNIDLAGIREEVDVFMFEGHDTTSSAVLSCFYVISTHEKVRNKLEEEVDEIFRGNASRDVTYDDLSKMPYLDAFFREVLRMYPPVPTNLRKVDKDFRLNDKHLVPKGTELCIQAYNVHRDPKHALVFFL